MPLWWGDRIEREADAWIARLHGPDGERQTAGLQAWRAADPRHEAAFQRSERLWRDTGGATRVAPAAAASSSPAAGASRDRGPRFAFAAIVATVAAAGGAYLFERSHGDRMGSHAQLASEASPQTVVLSDGSTVLLGKDSLIATDFDGATRAISLLRGKARFTVAHDAVHPFVVSADGRTVTARGTVFDVALHPEGLSVTMIEGVVEVAHKVRTGTAQPAAIRLARGERLVVSGASEQVSTPDQTSSNGALPDYGSTPVATIVENANMGAARPIWLEDPTLGTKRVQGRFDLSDTFAVAQQLAAALDVNLVDDGRTLILSRKTVP